jgi:hypothetical protein
MKVGDLVKLLYRWQDDVGVILHVGIMHDRRNDWATVMWTTRGITYEAMHSLEMVNESR